MKISSLYAKIVNWFYARFIGFGKPATGFKLQPEPRSIGNFAKGLQLGAGNIMFAGHLIEAKGTILWDIASPDKAFSEETHGFGWLDDLAAVGDSRSRKIAQDWVQSWIDNFGKGVGPGWTPEITGRRLIRWIHHGVMLLQGLDRNRSENFFKSLARQTLFLSRRWHTTSPGISRFEALTGLICSGLALEGMEKYVKPATIALSKECQNQIDPSGGIPTRNPEELLEVFMLLTWVSLALRESGWNPSPSHIGALERIAPTLRMLRHLDGSLARFHGGGAGIEGWLDQALVESGNKKVPEEKKLFMGFSRMSADGVSIIVDSALPPKELASASGHASTLAIEMVTDRYPLIVNCGSGVSFGEEWSRAGRATSSHSGLCISNSSSSNLSFPFTHGGKLIQTLIDGPSEVSHRFGRTTEGTQLEIAHDGYIHQNGVKYSRKVFLVSDGTKLSVEEILVSNGEKQRQIFDTAYENSNLQGINCHLRLHLHPDVIAELDLGGEAVSLLTKRKDIWVFRKEGPGEISIESSVYFEKGRLHPRPSKQIVLSLFLRDYTTQIAWTLEKAQVNRNIY